MLVCGFLDQKYLAFNYLYPLVVEVLRYFFIFIFAHELELSKVTKNVSVVALKYKSTGYVLI